MDFTEIKQTIEKEVILTEKIVKLVERYEHSQNSDEKNMIKANVETLQHQLKIFNDNTPNLLTKIETSKPLQINKPKSEMELEVKKISELKSVGKEEPRKKLNKKNEDELLSEVGIEKGVLEKKRKSILSKKIKDKEVKSNFYIKTSNKLFSDISDNFVRKNYFQGVREDLIKAKMPMLLTSYVSVIFFTTLLIFIFSIFVLLFLVFFDVSFSSPYLTIVTQGILMRFAKFGAVVIVLPLITSIFMYFYPSLEKGYLATKIDEELPFMTIHMSAIAGSHVEPSQIFRILASTEDYPFTRKEMVSLINKINVYGYNLAGALRDGARKSPSGKLRDLFNGLATTITSGGSLEDYFSERSKNLLFEYRLEQERKNKNAETFMDIYISIVIAAPMIFMLLLVLIVKTGLSGLNLTVGELTIIIIGVVSLINIVFLIVLHLKQPGGSG